MDDFLHNLRSGKLKQQDRSNRSYNDPHNKGGQRRGSMDRRKKELETFERLNAVKEVLESISGTQKRMADAYEVRTKAEERKARAMEVLAKNIYCMLNPNADDADALFAPEIAPEIAPEVSVEEATHKVEYEEPPELPEPPSEAKTSDKLTSNDRKALCKLIEKMRDKGNNWEKIAREIVAQGYPTASGKGTWRGVMAKNIYEKQTAK